MLLQRRVLHKSSGLFHHGDTETSGTKCGRAKLEVFIEERDTAVLTRGAITCLLPDLIGFWNLMHSLAFSVSCLRGEKCFTFAIDVGEGHNQGLERASAL